MPHNRTAPEWLRIIGPGILVAATGVGAGDLATGAFAGNRLGVAVLWAVVVGAALKWCINEGLARWQLVTGTTFLQGCFARWGRPFGYLFLIYLVIWTIPLATALMSACAVAVASIVPAWNTHAGRAILGIVHSGVALFLVRQGGFKLFERIMGCCIAMMFVVAIMTAVALRPDPQEIARGLLWPHAADSDGSGWVIALLGGVGGTLTIVCYGYWIREEQRHGVESIPVCRADLAVGYLVTALFGIAMVIIGSQLEPIDGKGASLVITVAERLEATFGQSGRVLRWLFLIGAWGAFFSSLLGVWQSVPYLFADTCRGLTTSLRHDEEGVGDGHSDLTKTLAYRGYLYGMATIPSLGLLYDNFRDVQKIYAIVGALCIPLLSLLLLRLNRSAALGHFRYRWPMTAALLGSVFVSVWLLGRQITAAIAQQ